MWKPLDNNADIDLTGAEVFVQAGSPAAAGITWYVVGTTPEDTRVYSRTGDSHLQLSLHTAAVLRTSGRFTQVAAQHDPATAPLSDPAPSA